MFTLAKYKIILIIEGKQFELTKHCLTDDIEWVAQQLKDVNEASEVSYTKI